MKPVTFVKLDQLGHPESRALQSLFHDLNRQFFRGRLPTYGIIYGPPPGGPRGCSGLCEPETRTLYVEPSPPTLDGLRRVLLHEMCHIGSLGHGKSFQAELRRLAAAGEAWADQEATQLAAALATRRSPTAAIAQHIRDTALDFLDKQWSDVEMLVAVEMGRSVEELRRAAPWAERLWQRAVSEIRRDREAGKELLG